MLVLQTVLPALLLAKGGSSLTLEGGTHNPQAPFDFIKKVFLPLVNRMGPRVAAEIERHGFHPAGGGRFRIDIEPSASLARLDLPERGSVRGRGARALVANLPFSIAERELAIVNQKLSWKDEWLRAELLDNSRGPGNVLMIEIESEHVTELFAGFGERGVRAEAVAEKAVKEARQYLAVDAAGGECLADQLLIPLALAGGGSFTTVRLSRHAATNIEIIRKFLDVDITTAQLDNRTWKVKVSS